MMKQQPWTQNNQVPTTQDGGAFYVQQPQNTFYNPYTQNGAFYNPHITQTTQTIFGGRGSTNGGGYDFRDAHKSKVSSPHAQPRRKTRWGSKPTKEKNSRSRSRSPKGSNRLMQSTREDAELVHAHLLGLSDAKHLRESKKPARRTRFRESRFDKRSFQEDAVDLKDRARREKINISKMEQFPVHITPPKGETAPKPIESFDGVVLHTDIKENLQKENFSKPTPIQQYAIPIIHADMDLMAAAHTGSGKTIAFLAPVVSRILEIGEVPRPFFPGKIAFASPLAVIIVPTRELATQMDEVVFKLTKKTWIRSFAIFGGDNFNDQADQINIWP